jgi:RHH-type proline utilization regulon transcriptional repressor/proline dehydrogenase/delta 1-pyrroline-5-carboxylate dehydrogenase
MANTAPSLALGDKLASESDLVGRLRLAARLPDAMAQQVDRDAMALAEQLRAAGTKGHGVETFLAEFELSTSEGVALMCLAEALLRIPDAATIDALIGDKLGTADWDKHLGQADSVLVNASAWGLALTGRFVEWSGRNDGGAGDLLRRVVGRMGAPVVRRAIEAGMRIMGQQFVMGETIAAALARAAKAGPGYRHSYDMLGEAARTADDAERYFDSYAAAIAAIAGRCAGKDPHRNPGISIKISALHPRYEPAKRARATGELLPRLVALAEMAAAAGINFTIDAEEADRLVLSLELFESLARDRRLAGWDGLGLAVQAYQKRAVATVDWLAGLGQDAKRRLMVRLVKGAYWDSEIKWAQERGLADYPVYVRKPATDLSYRACAMRMFAAGEAIYGQFATHNPRSGLEILALAGGRTDFEFQKLHGMGDALYGLLEKRLGEKFAVRVYAPVGAHRDLLPYLVRRLLENGANTSFIHQIADHAIPLARIVADPGAALDGASPSVRLPGSMFADRANAAGLDLADDAVRAAIMARIADDRAAAPSGNVREPADPAQAVGDQAPTTVNDMAAAIGRAQGVFPEWRDLAAAKRAAILERAADLFEAARHELMSLIVREGGRTIPDALSELREAVDFLRYYAVRARGDFAPVTLPGPTGERNTLRLEGRGVFACVSPWNFPLAIFTGQIAAALAAGNTVVAKPAPQTPLTGRRAAALLREAGVPADVLSLVYGGRDTGAALIGDPRIAGVAFTGSTATAKSIQRALAAKDGPIVPLIAETGGVNAMVADSSALTEQLVNDAIVSAFQSAGQRCSALRVLFVQEDAADRTVEMLKGALAELRIGDPADPAVDIGPVIDADAKRNLDAYLAGSKHRRVAGGADVPGTGHFVAPVALEVPLAEAPMEEIFGPVLHVVRWRSGALDDVLARIRATGYGLTLGIHSRLESFQARVRAGVSAGNVYVNRSTIGAVVGVQPFGGHGLSGTGPKAGGPNYLPRFAVETSVCVNTAAVGGDVSLMASGQPV